MFAIVLIYFFYEGLFRSAYDVHVFTWDRALDV